MSNSERGSIIDAQFEFDDCLNYLADLNIDWILENSYTKREPDGKYLWYVNFTLEEFQKYLRDKEDESRSYKGNSNRKLSNKGTSK